MSLRIRKDDVAEQLGDVGHQPSEWDGDDWDPGYRVAQHGPRQVNVFHDGPGEAHHLGLYEAVLRNLGYVTHTTCLDVAPAGSRQRLEVTRAH